MRIRNALFWMLRHSAAGMVSAGFLTVASLVIYFICAAIGDDAGGPMTPFLISLFCILGGCGVALVVYFPLSLLLGWALRKLHVPFWVLPAAFFILAFLFLAGWLALAGKHVPSVSDLGVATLGSLFLTAGFMIYRLVLVAGSRLLARRDATIRGLGLRLVGRRRRGCF